MLKIIFVQVPQAKHIKNLKLLHLGKKCTVTLQKKTKFNRHFRFKLRGNNKDIIDGEFHQDSISGKKCQVKVRHYWVATVSFGNGTFYCIIIIPRIKTTFTKVKGIVSTIHSLKSEQ